LGSSNISGVRLIRFLSALGVSASQFPQKVPGSHQSFPSGSTGVQIVFDISGRVIANFATYTSFASL
jgi:peptidoglycan/LPS O-acetylase OafA/YrhL